LIVELDGGQHANQLAYDERRSLGLQAMGYRVQRFWNNDVLVNLEGVLEVLLGALASPGPSPQPSPRRGEGGRGLGDPFASIRRHRIKRIQPPCGQGDQAR
jgi:hypothetical protein